VLSDGGRWFASTHSRIAAVSVDTAAAGIVGGCLRCLFRRVRAGRQGSVRAAKHWQRRSVGRSNETCNSPIVWKSSISTHRKTSLEALADAAGVQAHSGGVPVLIHISYSVNCGQTSASMFTHAVIRGPRANSKRSHRRCAWACDPMHAGAKTLQALHATAGHQSRSSISGETRLFRLASSGRALGLRVGHMDRLLDDPDLRDGTESRRSC
jgi:hypothetical protein